ncbi:hypothetical protein A3A66_04800 [Microgenomates group bacterium RIFCSPLOWO2_01_FULL_46_13]|nr:MAG: hypothetical protein A2783_00260 [Microgenomates group bacterium RIFCSPHIGHO2_01_FULL_45_11]OGV94285.1 MAG: hypothetical protein A3A66_04800 [Microgenomates group bacterium RIFCSPLOWO2_01_FULL_46_13]
MSQLKWVVSTLWWTLILSAVSTLFVWNSPRPVFLPSASPTPFPTSYPNPSPLPEPSLLPLPSSQPPSGELLSDGNIEAGSYPLISAWNDSANVDLNRWYMVKALANIDSVPIKTLPSAHGVYWAYLVNFVPEGSSTGLLALDLNNCASAGCETAAIQLVPAQAGVKYRLSANGFLLSGDSGTLYLDFLNDNRQRLKVNTIGSFPFGKWGTREIIDIAPSGTAYIRVILYSSTKAVGKMLWDNVSLWASQ